VNSKRNCFSVAIIPYTFNNTNFNQLKEGNNVNLEFDILGKYIAKILSKST
jgi:riboflavin synthase